MALKRKSPGQKRKIKKPLTPKQRCFVEEYLVDFNGRQAVIRSGAKTKNPDQMAYQWLQLPSVLEEIELGLKFRLASTGLNSQSVIEELTRIVKSDITRIVSWKNGALTLKDSSKLGPADSACIQEISQDKNGGFKIKLYPKMEAIKTLMEYMGISRPDPSATTEDAPESITFNIQPKGSDDES